MHGHLYKFLAINLITFYHIIHHDMNVNQPEPITPVYDTRFNRYDKGIYHKRRGSWQLRYVKIPYNKQLTYTMRTNWIRYHEYNHK